MRMSRSLSSGPPVVVIGAGASGLTAVKTCLEHGLDVVCFEKTDDVGGLWRFREEVLDGVASVTRNTIINTSKEMTAFSDFPPPPHFPNFMHNRYMAHYLESYARHFRLQDHIRFRHRVLSLEQAEDYAQSGQWKVKVQNESDCSTREELASAVLVCSGHHNYPYVPPLKGLDEFKGRVLHTHALKHSAEFEEKNVLVVGLGNSGGDAAVELSHVADKVYLSSRRGTWVMPRLGDYGIPIDIQYGRRHIVFLLNLLPQWFKNLHAEFKLNVRFHHRVFNLEPDHRFYSQHPMVNDDLPGRLLSGSVTLKGDVERLTDSGVVFGGEPGTVHPVDAVVLATGYTIRFPFLSDDLLETRDNRLDLYKYVFPPALPRPTLAFVGFVQPFGSIPPISEVQSRWICRLLTGAAVLPSALLMAEDVERTRRRHDERFVATRRHTIEVDGIPYMDEVARLAGVHVPWWTLLLTDLRLFLACAFGPSVAYHYRLNGTHSWSEARRAILGVGERVATPLNTRRRTTAGATRNTFFQSVVASAITLGFFLLLVVFGI